MKVLLLGSNGQLGWELKQSVPKHINLTCCDFPKVDFLSSDSINQCILSSVPDCIINAAAYTAVDKAEEEKSLAFRINHKAVVEIAALCQKNNIFFVHISTDFIFNGKGHHPYKPIDNPDPVSIYGLSKLKGEQAILETLKSNYLIIRTAWLYSAHGANFVKTMLNLMKDKKDLTVIDEQIGSPTWANGLAQSIWLALEKKISGIHHWTDAGIASWYDFAVAIQEEALQADLLKKPVIITPVPTSHYPTPAQRPNYGVLDKTSFWKLLNIPPIHWRNQLRSMLKELK
jgi:dTDP-4-dehydrorhamnose reductase